MRRVAVALIAAGLAGHALAAPQGAQDRLDEVRAEARKAEERADALAAEAEAETDRARRIQARRQEFVGRIEAGEARLAVARIEERRLARTLATLRAGIAREQAPAAALAAGLATLSRLPPVLTLADAGSIEAAVRVQAIVEATAPVITERTAGLRARHERLAALANAVEQRRTRIAAEQAGLDETAERLAALESRSRATAGALNVAASRADARAIAARERTADLADAATREAFAAEIAEDLATYPAAPRLPGKRKAVAGEADADRPPFAYALPLHGTVSAGVGSLSPDGVRGRGMTIAARRGAAVRVPANGRIVFAGPFRGRDGVVVIDHGDGWLSLLSNLVAERPVEARVTRGQRLGSALGPVDVELWHRQRPVSPAIIAGSF